MVVSVPAMQSSKVGITCSKKSWWGSFKRMKIWHSLCFFLYLTTMFIEYSADSFIMQVLHLPLLFILLHHTSF